MNDEEELEYIEISALDLGDINGYTKELAQEIQRRSEFGLIYYTQCKDLVLFSNTKLEPKEAEVLCKIIDNDDGLDMIMQDGIQTSEALYKYVIM